MKRSICLAIIWFCFACIFFGLSYYHYKESQNEITPIKLEFKGSVAGGVMGVSTGVSEMKIFAQGVSDYIVEYNKNTRRQNKIAAGGYFFAGLTSLFSMLLGVIQNIKYNRLTEKDNELGEKIEEEKMKNIMGVY